MQGIQLDKDYYRAGWEYPHAVALLYALYLYAEHTGRKSFTFSELVNAHSNPDAKGISPADIYGIDVKKFAKMCRAWQSVPEATSGFPLWQIWTTSFWKIILPTILLIWPRNKKSRGVCGHGI